MMLGRFTKFIKSYITKLKNYRKVKLGFPCEIQPNTEFEGCNKIGNHSRFSGKMGWGSYIGHHCEIGAQIGRFTSIASHVRSNKGVHPYKAPYVSTSPMFYSTQKQTGCTFSDRVMFKEFLSRPIIGNDCWICENVFICGGVKIGDGVVILAGAVVTKDVPPYAIVGGIPAQIIDYRYDKETIDFLNKIQWWNNDIVWFKKNWHLMSDIQALKRYYNQKQ